MMKAEAPSDEQKQLRQRKSYLNIRVDELKEELKKLTEERKRVNEQLGVKGKEK